MTKTILGLDIGGANIKAATADGRSWHEPFSLWKNPVGLSAVLVEVLARFPDASHLAIAMTGELCDCFETKSDGVTRILDAVEAAASDRTVSVWGTDSRFHLASVACEKWLTVAAANWHALATFIGRHAPANGGLLIDIGSTTSDIIPLEHGVPHSTGLTDYDRMKHGELVYTGVRRTPVCAVAGDSAAAEFFGTMHDVYVVLGLIPEDVTDTDTADNRPATVELSLARLARMLGGDRNTLKDEVVIQFAVAAYQRQLAGIVRAIRRVRDGMNEELTRVIVSGSGEFLARRAVKDAFPDFTETHIISLTTDLGERLSACAPAYALAVLAQELKA